MLALMWVSPPVARATDSTQPGVGPDLPAEWGHRLLLSLSLRLKQMLSGFRQNVSRLRALKQIGSRTIPLGAPMVRCAYTELIILGRRLTYFRGNNHANALIHQVIPNVVIAMYVCVAAL